MKTKASKIINNFDKVCDVIREDLPDDIAINVFVYVRDRSQECRINNATLDWEIRTRQISKWCMSYDMQTLKAMSDERYYQMQWTVE